jgi:hypothetical protein
LAAGQTPYGMEKGYGYVNMLEHYLATEGLLGSYKDF